MSSPAFTSTRSIGHRAPLLWLVLPMMAGLGAAKMGYSAPPSWLFAAGLSAVVVGAAVASRSACVSLALLASAMFLAGVASYQTHSPNVGAWDSLPPREMRLTVRIDRPFSSSNTRRSSALATIVRADRFDELAGRRVYLSIDRRRGESPLIRSAVAVVDGVLETLPADPSVDSFDGYLVNAGIQFRLTRGRLIEEKMPPSRYAQFCARSAQYFATVLGRGVENKRPRLVAVYRAMLLGQQSELSEEQRSMFRESGTMHVFSISGLHIAAIAAGLHALLSAMRLPSLVRYGFGLLTLWLYVDITGAAPSAIRAFIMVALIQSALALRVARNPIAALTASSLIILLIDPLQLFSASFQMSYGIVAALLLLGLPLADRWQQKLALFRHLPPATWGWPRKVVDVVWRGLVSASAIGIAAALVGAVTGLTFFKLFTPGAFLANLWLIPASTGVLFMGMISLLCGLVGFADGSSFANHAAVLLLWGIESGTRLVVGLPGVWIAGEFKLPWLGSVAFSALLAVLAMGYANNWSGPHRYFWAPFALVIVTLLFGVQFH